MRLWTPEGKEGVNRVNNPEDTIRVGVKDLGAAIYRYHGGGAVSDFAWNIDGRVAVVHCHGSHGKPVLYCRWHAVALPLWQCHKLP